MAKSANLAVLAALLDKLPLTDRWRPLLENADLDECAIRLKKLPPRVRQAVMLRVEFGLPYEVIANAILSPSANAARMLCERGLARLAAAA